MFKLLSWLIDFSLKNSNFSLEIKKIKNNINYCTVKYFNLFNGLSAQRYSQFQYRYENFSKKSVLDNFKKYGTYFKIKLETIFDFSVVLQ